MKIQCPKCKQIVPPDQVNMATDLAFCPQCNDGFKISESIDQEPVSADVLRDPPKGTWFRKERWIGSLSARQPVRRLLSFSFRSCASGRADRSAESTAHRSPEGNSISRCHFSESLSCSAPFSWEALRSCRLSAKSKYPSAEKASYLSGSGRSAGSGRSTGWPLKVSAKIRSGCSAPTAHRMPL